MYGLDFADGGARQQAIEHARDSGRIATSAIFTLVTARGDQRGSVVVIPVYRPGVPHDTVQERRDNLVGFVHAGFQTSMMLESIINSTTKGADLNLYFFAGDGGADQATLLYYGGTTHSASIGPQPWGELTAGPHWSGTLNVGDVHWTLIASPIAGGPAAASHASAWVVLISGLILCGGLICYIWATGQHARRLRTANDHLDRTNLHLDAAVNNMPQGLLMFDASERLVVCNDRYIEMYGLSREIVKPGCSVPELLRYRVASGQLTIDPDEYRRELKIKLSKGESERGVMSLVDGRDMLITHTPMHGGGWVATHEDITERRLAEAKIAHMALHDALTDLPNRHLFNKQLASRFSQLGRGEKIALLCLDLDRFKDVNDTLGHPFGDKLLIQVAERLRGCVRQSDSVARLGGDEFAILQGGLSDLGETASLAERIIEAISAPFNLAGHQALIGISIGIAVGPVDATDTDQLLIASDSALYRAKADGRGTYRFFESAMDQRIQARRGLELDLRRALTEDEFVLHYQPLVNLRTRQICGFEALICWNHPKRGMLSPADFVSFAEETGMIVPIGAWAIQSACDEAAKWPSGIRVAVNLSPVQFRTSGLYKTVSDALSRSGLAADCLELEITESTLLPNQESTLETLRRSRDRGIRIALDDFGTGHSSLSYLRNFPFDRIKIDRSFVHDLLTKKDSRAVIRALVQLAGGLGLKTTAEGVETEEELEYLKRAGCTEGQGFLFGKPQPAKNVPSMLTAGESSKAVA